MQTKSLSTNLSRDLIFTNGYFYDDTNAALTVNVRIARGIDVNGVEIQIPVNNYILSNIETIYEDPAFGDLLTRKSNLIQLVETVDDASARQQLKNFMKVYIETGVYILKKADSYYWLDRANKIQNEFSLDYCLTKAINLGIEDLKASRLILDVTNSEALAADVIESTLTKNIADTKRSQGLIQTKALTKDNKKNKK